MTTLTDVLQFIATASIADRNIINSVLNGQGNPLTRQQKAANTLAQITNGDKVTFPYDGVTYHGIVQRINRTTATIKVTQIDGMNRNRIQVGGEVRVGASILARGL